MKVRSGSCCGSNSENREKARDKKEDKKVIFYVFLHISLKLLG